MFIVVLLKLNFFLKISLKGKKGRSNQAHLYTVRNFEIPDHNFTHPEFKKNFDM